MNLLQDVLTYIRRILKSSNNGQIPDNLLIDYVNRFWLMDVDARIQVYDLKTTYQFMTQPGQDKYNMPLYNLQFEPGGQVIGPFPVYQGMQPPARINGITVSFYTQRSIFYDLWPDYAQSTAPVAIGNNTVGPYTLTLPFGPGLSTGTNQPQSGILQGYIDMAGIIASGLNPIQQPPLVTAAQIAQIGISGTGDFIQNIPVTSVYSAVYFTSQDSTGNNVVICDSGQFLAVNRYSGLLMQQGAAPFGNLPLTNGAIAQPLYSQTQNTFNFQTGIAQNVYFPVAIPRGQNINATAFLITPGLPRAILWYNNCITLRSPPDKQYLVQLDAYLSPAAFLNSAEALPFGYMAEYIARGAARKILADTGDWEQFNAYEPLFREQEMLVWKRSQRQWTSTRTDTIYSNTGFGSSGGSNGLYGSGAT